MTLLQEAGRETAHESNGYLKGVAIAIVTQNKDDEGLCRVKVRFPWHEDDTESYWARIASPMAGNDRGLVLIPEVDDEVLVAFEREDLRFPYILGALWNGQDKPPVANDDGRNDVRLFKSRVGSELRFIDKDNQSVVQLKQVQGREVVLDHTGFKVTDENGNVVKVDSNSGTMTIEAKGQLNIKATAITIESSGTLEIKAGATLTVRGSLVNIN